MDFKIETYEKPFREYAHEEGKNWCANATMYIQAFDENNDPILEEDGSEVWFWSHVASAYGESREAVLVEVKDKCRTYVVNKQAKAETLQEHEYTFPPPGT